MTVSVGIGRDAVTYLVSVAVDWAAIVANESALGRALVDPINHAIIIGVPRAPKAFIGGIVVLGREHNGLGIMFSTGWAIVGAIASVDSIKNSILK